MPAERANSWAIVFASEPHRPFGMNALDCRNTDRIGLGCSGPGSLALMPRKRDHARPGTRGVSTGSGTVFLVGDSHPPLQSVVGKLAAVRADIDRDQLIPRVPLEGAGAIAGEIAICVNGSTYVWYPHRHDGQQRRVQLGEMTMPDGPFDRCGRQGLAPSLERGGARFAAPVNARSTIWL